MKLISNYTFVSVVRSKCPSYVGTEGILLQETQNTLKLIGKDNSMKSAFADYSAMCSVAIYVIVASDLNTLINDSTDGAVPWCMSIYISCV